MRRAGAALAGVFTEAMEWMQPGAITRDIDRLVEQAILRRGGRPAFKGYRGGNSHPFPTATCISIEEEVVHGIPSHRRLVGGSLVGLDAGLELDGWFADMAASFLIEPGDARRRPLQEVTLEALYRGIDAARVGNRLSDIGRTIEDWVVGHGFKVIRDLVGHGIGSQLHEEPAVANYYTRSGDVKLTAGMTLAIEPMVSAGDWRIRFLRDEWTAVTADGAPACHFEHTVLITSGEPEILTLLEDGTDPWQTGVFAELGVAFA